MKFFHLIYILPFAVLLSCQDEIDSKLFVNYNDSNRTFNYKLHNDHDSVFQFKFTHPVGALVKNNKVYHEVTIDWFLKKQNQMILCSQNRVNFRPLFSFSKEDSIQTYLFEDGTKYKIERTIKKTQNNKDVYFFRIIDYRCSSKDPMVSLPPFLWCDLVFIMTENDGFIGVYLSLYGDEIFDDRYNEYMYYPLGFVEKYMSLDSVKVMDRVSRPNYISR